MEANLADGTRIKVVKQYESAKVSRSAKQNKIGWSIAVFPSPGELEMYGIQKLVGMYPTKKKAIKALDKMVEESNEKDNPKPAKS